LVRAKERPAQLGRCSSPSVERRKQGAGKLTGDKELERKGQADKAKGDVHKVAGNVKDARAMPP
jgi:hypothetical protein